MRQGRGEYDQYTLQEIAKILGNRSPFFGESQWVWVNQEGFKVAQDWCGKPLAVQIVVEERRINGGCLVLRQ